MEKICPRSGRIWWVEGRFGGRSRPAGPSASITTIALTRRYHDPLGEAGLFSLNVRCLFLNADGSWEVEVAPLSPRAPEDLLMCNECFALLDGRRIIGVGTIHDLSENA